LLLGRALFAPLEATCLKAPVDTNGKVVGDLEKYGDTESSADARKLRVELTPLAMSTTSSMPTSPRVAATTSGGRPKTNENRSISALTTSRNNRIRTLTSLGDLTGTGVLVVKSSDESDRITPEVDLVMDRTLGENGSLAFTQFVDDEAGSVLLNEPGFQVAVDEEKELGRSGMGVGSVHSARSRDGLARVLVERRSAP
jgi:hypothetical protein